MKIIFPVDQHARTNPSDIAIISDKRKITYRELANITNNIAQQFLQLKVTNRIAVILPLSMDYLLLFIALQRLNILVIPINSSFPDQKIQETLDEYYCAFVICERGRFFSCEKVFYVDDIITNNNSPSTVVSQEIKLNKHSTAVFTSGSVGKAKGIVHSFGNHYYSAKGSNNNIPLVPGDRWLLSLPLYHVAGIAIVFRCLVAGATIVFSCKDIIAAACDYKITHVSLVTTQLHRMLDSDIPDIKHILVGGSAFAHSLIERSLLRDLNIYTSYGSTEMSSQIATTKRINSAKEAHFFKPLQHREIQISTEGEIMVKGKTLFQGYLKGKEFVKLEGTWFYTGDYGIIKDGLLQVHGRKDHMFISGGENIHPQEIENELCSLLEVHQAIVVAIPHREFGFRPVAFVDSLMSTEQLKQYLQKRIAKFKVPDQFLPWPQNVPLKGIKPDRHYFEKLAQQRNQ
ncbi:o-succinylbenzoate--CoA ligase [Candidatus Uabimicrobium sp. HlEnr_7]|uniref:o-succinylbenzoate--CoA ligase n=1 Tax=Candidatus Uabimicrobium helgolandensis TaxID=3095367 RepID=UPI003556EA52